MGFEDPPQGLRTTPGLDGITIHVDPYLPDHGHGDLKRILAAVGGGALVYRMALLVGSRLVWVGLAVAVLLVAGSLVGAGIRAWQRGRQLRTRIELRVGRDDLRLEETLDGRSVRRERLFLRDVGRVDVREPAYQRPHVVVAVAGREAVAVPMERHPIEAAAWLASELADAGRAARKRDGEGIREIPDPLRSFTPR
ncbi:MAG: hypothetical protein ABMB14_03025 [Myxococcota bacterium]